MLAMALAWLLVVVLALEAWLEVRDRRRLTVASAAVPGLPLWWPGLWLWPWPWL